MNKLHLHLLFIFCIAGINSGFSQPSFEWVDQLGGSNADAVYSVATDAAGNVYASGNENGRVKIHKRDANGGYVWTKTVGAIGGNSLGFSVNLDGAGNVIVTGAFDGTGDFDPGAGTYNLTSNGNHDIFVLKLDNSGNFIWAASVGGTGIDRGYSVTTDNLNNVIVTGVHQNTVDFDPGAGVDNYTAGGGLWDYFIMKLDPNGAFQWAISSQNGGSEYSNSVACDPSNNIYITGDFSASLDFDPGVGSFNMAPTNATAGYLLKVDANGNFIWAKMFTGNNRCYPSTVDIDSNGDIITSGEYMDDLDADPGPGVFTLNTNGVQDVYIIKLDSNGDFLWANSFGGTVPDESFGLTTDASNNIYTAGYFETTVDFDPGPGVYSLSDNGIYDIFVQKLDANGDFVWAIAMGGTSWDRGMDVAVDNASGSLFVGGYFHNAVDFDPGAGVSNLNAIGSGDGYILKLSDCVPSAPTPDLGSLPNLNDECSVSAPVAPTASNCLGTYTGTPDLTFPITSQGTTVVTWTYDDGNGNISTQTQNVILTDVTAPVPDNNSLADVNEECEVTVLTPPTATDNCSGSVTVTNNATLPINTQGTTVVTWSYDDGNGNTSTQTQNVIITDMTAPVPDVANLVNYSDECPVELATIGGAPSATDNCSGAIIGTPDVTFPITASGTTTITWTYDDGNGNTSTQTQDVTITSIDNGIIQVDAVTLSADASAAAYTYQWVDCDNGNALVNGATSQTFTPTVAGSYACIIDNGFCSVTTDCLTSSVDIVENSFGSALVVYPNPTLGQLKIDLGDTYDGISVQVFNAIGQAVIDESFGSTDEIELSIEGTPGMYVLEIKTENGTAAKVTIVKK